MAGGVRASLLVAGGGWGCRGRPRRAWMWASSEVGLGLTSVGTAATWFSQDGGVGEAGRRRQVPAARAWFQSRRARRRAKLGERKESRVRGIENGSRLTRRWHITVNNTKSSFSKSAADQNASFVFCTGFLVRSADLTSRIWGVRASSKHRF
jgi:hypothetical protein